MRSRGYRRFVAIFVGVLLAFAVVAAILTQDQSMIVMCFVVGALYAIYMIQFVRWEKEYRDKTATEKKSPLMRR